MSKVMAYSVSLLLLMLSFFAFVHSLPFVVFHGINDGCSKNEGFTGFLRNNSHANGYCIEVGNGGWDSWFMPIEDQIEFACNQVKSMKELQTGFNLVGLSQGNIIARGIIQLCDGAPPVKNYISVGGPHAGVAAVPLCGSTLFCELVDDMIKSGVYSDFVQDHLAPSNYIKVPNDISNYLKKCKLLPRLNNEIPGERNATYRQRFSSLQNLVLIMSEEDKVLVPKETSWFGFYPDGAFDPVLQPQKTKLYTEDWIGLRTLDAAGKVKFISVEGAHVRISDSDKMKYIVPYLKN